MLAAVADQLTALAAAAQGALEVVELGVYPRKMVLQPLLIRAVVVGLVMAVTLAVTVAQE
jgi:flagellar biosynthesis protein FliQ